MKVILVMAMTLDGKIARDSNHSADWTGKDDKKKFVEITKRAGAMIMGSKTFDTIGRALPGRKNIVMTRNRSRKSDGNLIFTDQPPDLILKGLDREGFSEVALIGGTQINSLFAQANLIDEIFVTVVPIFFGRGLSLFDCEMDNQLELLGTEIISDQSLVLRYRVKKK
ncbi:FolA [Desulforapulum autotrophicum HRM2]|uniref:FolA n=1 Tax=Desulforapulum autotrophicum (strain ATCC 43914 / DSM 3382 / VKM B-1955 / HRM2) TaxID=177437 RepID=C0QKC0_DESAH|nr:dihydrofolate reductase family protein [Desulforapulum autotrophicum]ACN13991.1 FolA [Desulforapulum autotrophicum HRM2]